jgi:hypothetical protein
MCGNSVSPVQAEALRELRAGRLAAFAARARLQPTRDLAERIVRAVRVLVRSPEWQREEGRFVPKLSKWLRNQGWLMVREVASAPVPAPTPAPEVVLTPEEQAAKAAMAREAKERARRLIEQYRRERVAA